MDEEQFALFQSSPYYHLPNLQLSDFWRDFFEMKFAQERSRKGRRSPLVQMTYSFLCGHGEFYFPWVKIATAQRHALSRLDGKLDGLTILPLTGVHSYIYRLIHERIIDRNRLSECLEVVGAAIALNIGKDHRPKQDYVSALLEGCRVWQVSQIERQRPEALPTRFPRALLGRTKIFSIDENLNELSYGEKFVYALLIIDRSVERLWPLMIPQSDMEEVICRSEQIMGSFIESASDRLSILKFLLGYPPHTTEIHFNYVTRCVRSLDYGGVRLLSNCKQDLTSQHIANFAKILFSIQMSAQLSKPELLDFLTKLCALCDKIDLAELANAILSSDDLSTLLHLSVVSWIGHELKENKGPNPYGRVARNLLRKGAFPGRPEWFHEQSSLSLAMSGSFPFASDILANTCCIPSCEGPPLDKYDVPVVNREVPHLRCLAAFVVQDTAQPLSKVMKRRMIWVKENVVLPVSEFIEFHTKEVDDSDT